MSIAAAALAIIAAAAAAVGAVDPAGAQEAGPFTAVEYAILPPAGETPKAEPFTASAGIGDRVRITLTADKALESAPRIHVSPSLGAHHLEVPWAVMERGAAPNTWTHTHTVAEVATPVGFDAGSYSYAYTAGHPLLFVVTPQPGSGERYTFTQSSLPASTPRVDPSRPQVLHAGFTRPDTIHVAFNEHLLASSSAASALVSCIVETGGHCYNAHLGNTLAINGLAYGVTAPDGTNAPDDADADADVIALLPSGVRYWPTADPTDIIVKLAGPATPGATYTLELPVALTDVGGNQFADRTVDVAYAAGFTAETVDARTTVVTFPGAVGGSLHTGSWTLTSDEVVDERHAGKPYHSRHSAPNAIPMDDVAHGRSLNADSVTLGSPADAPTFTYLGTHRQSMSLPESGAPSAWWRWGSLLGIPASSTESTIVIRHAPVAPSSALTVSYTPPGYHLRLYMHPGSANPEATGSTDPDFMLPYTEADLVDAQGTYPLKSLSVDGAGVARGIAAAADAWPPAFTARATSPTTTAVEFSEPVSGTARAADWAVAEGAASRAVQSVRAGVHASAEAAAARAASASLSSATVITLTHEAVSRDAASAVSYTRPAAPIADAAGNGVASATARAGPLDAPADTVRPTFTARTVSPTLVEVTFSEPVSGAVASSQWTVGGATAASLRASQASGDPISSLSGATLLYLVAGPMTSDSRSDVSFAAPSLADAAGNTVAPATVTAADAAPPTVEFAATGPESTVVITFSEDVSGMTAINDWTVNGSTPAALLAGASGLSARLVLPATTSITLASGIDLAPDAEPTVTYMPSGSGVLVDTVSPSAPSHETATPLAALSITAVDGVAPQASASFAGPRAIAVTFSEALASPEAVAGLDYAVTVPDGAGAAPVAVSSASYDEASRTLTITLAAAAPTGVEHTVTLPTYALVDAVGNFALPETLAVTRQGAGSVTTPGSGPGSVTTSGSSPGSVTTSGSSPGSVTTSSPPAFTARTASPTLIEVAFGAPVSGVTAPAQWTVDGAAATTLRAAPGSADGVTVLAGATLLYLVTGPLAADATPVVAFAPPATPTLNGADGSAVPATSVTAADGIAPTIASAVPQTPSQVVITFSEGLWGTTSIADWTADGVQAAAMRASLGPGTWVPAPDSGPLRLGGSGAIMLIMAESLERAGAPDVVYAPAAGAADPLADAAGNPLLPPAVPVPPAPPAASSIDFVVFSGGAAKAGAGALFAGPGDTVMLRLELDSDVGAVPTVTLQGRGVSAAAMSQSDGDGDATENPRRWSYNYTVPAAPGAPDGPLSFEISAEGTLITASVGLADGVSVAVPTIDTAPPALAEGDSLHTRVRAFGASSWDAASAGVDDTIRITIGATEALDAAPARVSVARADGAPSQHAVEASGSTLNVLYTVRAADANGPVTFAVTVRDLAGNELALTHDDLTEVPGTPGSGHRAGIDTYIPVALTARTASTSSLVVELSEALPAGSATAVAAWTVPGATLSSADVAGSAVTLTYGDTGDTSFAPTVSYTKPPSGGLEDAARNSLESFVLASRDRVPPTAVSAEFDGEGRIVVTFSEVVYPPSSGWAVTHAGGSLGVTSVVPIVSDIPVDAIEGAHKARLTVTGAVGATTYTIAVPDTLYDRASSENTIAPGTTLTATYDGPADTDRPTFTARTLNATHVAVTFSEPVSGAVAAPQWTVAGSAASSLRAPPAPHAGSATLDGATTLHLATSGLAADARPAVAFAPPASPTLADAAGNAVAAATVTAADGIAPTAAASTAPGSAVTITFSESVSGATSVGDWRVDGSTPASLRAGGTDSTDIALSGATSLTLLSGIDLAPDSTPAVTYAPPASGGLTDTVAAAAPPHEEATPMAAQSLTAADGVAPTASAAFASATAIAVTFDEALASPATLAGLAYAVTAPDGDDAGTDPDPVAVSSAAYDAGSRTLTITLAAAATTGVEHTVTLPASGLADAAGNAAAPATLSATRPDTAPPAFTARTTAPSLVEVTFGEPVSGAVAAPQWTVDGAAATSLRASPASASEVTSLSGATSLYLVAGPLAADATPPVAFAPPAAPTLADAAGNAAPAATVTAADGIAPTIDSAVPRTAAQVVVTFTEALWGTTSSSDWAVDGAPAASLRVGLGPNTWVPAPENGALRLGGSGQVMIVMASNLEQGSSPTVSYAPAAGSADPLVDAAGNPLAPATETAPRQARATSASYSVLPPTGDTPRAAPYANHARDGDRIVLTMGLDAESPSAPRVTFPDGSTAEMSAGAAASSWTAAYTVDASAGVADGRFSFEATFGTARATEASFGAVPPLMDHAAPSFTARTSGLTSTAVTFSEPVTHPAVAASGWSVGGAAASSASVSGRTTLTLTHAALESSAATPDVSYAPPASPAADTAGYELPAATVAASDGAGPALDASAPPAFEGTSIVVTFDEPVTAPGVASVTATHGPTGTAASAAPAVSGATLTLPLGDSAAAGEWTVAVPAGVTDAAGNARAASAATATATYTPPATITAATLNTTSTVVTASAALSGTLDVSHWAVSEGETARAVSSITLGTAAVAPGTLSATAGSAHPIAAGSTGTAIVIHHAALSSTAATPTITHTAPSSGGLGAGGVPLPTRSAVAADGVAPEFTAATASLTETAVTFSEAVAQPSDAAAGWSVGGEAATAASAGPGTDTITLTHAALDSTAATPSVSYAPPTSPAADAAGNAVSASTVTASDGAGPTLDASAPPAFEGTSIVITFGEAVSAAGVSSLAITHGPTGATASAAPSVSGRTLTLSAGDAPAAGGWTVAIPATITDLAGNARAGSAATATATYTPPATISAATASETTTVVTASAALSGTLDVSHWAVSEGEAARAVSSIALGAADGAPLAEAGSVHSIASGSPEAVLVITHAALSSTAATPTVTHTAPATGGLAAHGLPLPTLSAVASDGAAPTFTASTASLTTTAVTFGEAVAQPSDVAAGWSIAGTAASSASAVDGTTITLTHAALASTGATPSVSYAPPASPAADSAGNAVAAATVTAADGISPSLDASAPPAFTAAGLVVTFTEPVAAPEGAFLVARHAATGTMVWAAPEVDGAEMAVPVGAAPAPGKWAVTIPATITDLAGNARGASAASVMATYSPAEFTAATQGTGQTVVSLSGAMSGTLDAAHWAVTESVGGVDVTRAVASVALGTGDGAQRAAHGSPYAIPAPAEETTLVIAHEALSSTAATPTITHTAAASGGLEAGGLPLRTLSAVAADGTAPGFTAATAGLTETTVTFGEAVTQPAEMAAGWFVGRTAASAARAGPGTDTITLTHAALGSTADTPTVSYSRPASPVTDLAGNVVESQSATAADGAGPALDASAPPAFEGTSIVITFGEDISAAGVASMTATHGPSGAEASAAPAVSGATLTLPLGGPLAAGEWTVAIPAGVTDLAGNARAGSAATASATHLPPVSISAATASATTTVVTASAALSGSPDAAHWAVTESVGGVDVTRAVASAELGASGSDIVITHEALSTTAATPTIAHTTPSSGGLAAHGLPLPTLSATASDGAAPTFTAATVALTETAVTLSEAVAHPDEAAAGWSVGGAAVEAASAEADGLTVTLTHAALASTGATPSVSYAPPASPAADPAGNAVAAATVTAADGISPALDASAPPAFMAAGLVVTFTEPVAAPDGAFLVARHAATGTMVWAAPEVDGAEMAVPVGAAPAPGKWAVTIPATITDLAGNARDASAASVMATYSPASFTAETTSATTTVVTASAALTGSPDAAHWAVTESVGGSDVARAVASAELGASGSDIVITHDALSTTAATPTIAHTAPASGGLVAGGLPLPTLSTVAADGAPPTFAVEPTGAARDLVHTVTFSEPVALVAGRPAPEAADWTFVGTHTATGGKHAVPASASTYAMDLAAGTVTLSPEPATWRAMASEGLRVAYEAANAAREGSVADLSPAANAMGPTEVPVTDTMPPTIVAGTKSPDTTLVTFTEQVTGTTDVSRWTVTGDDGVRRRVLSVATLEPGDVRGEAAASATLASPGSGFVLGHEALSSTSATPEVSYIAPAAGGARIADAAGNAVLPATVEAADWIPPRITGVSFPDATTMRVGFSEAMAGPIVASAFTVLERDGPLPGSRFLGTSVSMGVPEETPLGDAGTSVTVELDTPVPDGNYHLSVSRAHVTDASPTRNAYVALPLLPIVRDAPATFEAATASADTVTVTFSEPVAGTTGAADWAVGGAAVASATLDSASSATLRLASPLASTGATPEVSYTAPGAGGLLDTLPPGAPADAVASATVVASDGAAPALDASAPPRFADAGLVVTFTEPVAAPEGTFLVARHAATGTMVWATPSIEGAAMTVPVGAMPAPGRWAVTIPDTVADLAGNARADSAASVMATYSPDRGPAAPPPGFTAETRDLTSTVVTFAAALSGTLDTTNWAVTESPPRPGVHTGATALEAGEAARAAADAAAELPASPAVTWIVVHHAPLSSTAATPTVAYHAPDAGGLAAGGERVPSQSAAAADGIAPTFTAATSTVASVTVTFSEPVSGSTHVTEWRVAGAEPDSVSAAPGGERLDGATLSAAASLTLHLEAPGGLLPPDATPGVSYTASAGAGLHDAPAGGAAPNALASATVTATDGIPQDVVSEEGGTGPAPPPGSAPEATVAQSRPSATPPAAPEATPVAPAPAPAAAQAAAPAAAAVPVEEPAPPTTVTGLVRLSASEVMVTFSAPVSGEGAIVATAADGASQEAPVSIPAGAPRTSVAVALAGGPLSISAPGLADEGGRPVAPTAGPLEVAVGEAVAEELIVPDGAIPLTVSAPAGGETVTLDIAGLDGGDESAPDTFDSEVRARVAGAELVIPAGTEITDLGTTDTEVISVGRVGEASAAYGAGDAEEASEAAALAVAAGSPNALVELGKSGEEDALTFGSAVAVRLVGAAGSEHVFYVAGADADTVHAIPECPAGTTADDAPPHIGDGAAAMQECYVTAGADIVIWTNHFTQFGAANTPRTSASACDDCTPPTLGVTAGGERRVTGGFSYNGSTVNAELYYTPLAPITVETGEENVATIKVFEDTGAHNVRHVGLAFGLAPGQHFAESVASIGVHVPHSGEPRVTVDSPGGAIDAESVSADVGRAGCMAGAETECLVVTIRHTFAEPLDFNIVRTITWDERRNSWQNFFNHGVHVTGESLNPRHGIEVNGGNLVLYPLVPGSVDADGDGVYDHDERHVTHMLDADGRVWRLAPDGSYAPLRNLSSLHHEVDDSMYDESRMTSHGAARGTALFEEALAREILAAETHLAAMGMAAAPEAPAAPAAPAPEARDAGVDGLREAMEREIGLAELTLLDLYPELAGALSESDTPLAHMG